MTDLKNLEYNQYHQILCNSKKSVLDHTIGSLYGFENIYIYKILRQLRIKIVIKFRTEIKDISNCSTSKTIREHIKLK